MPRRPQTRRVVPRRPRRSSSAKPIRLVPVRPTASRAVASPPFSTAPARGGRPSHGWGAAQPAEQRVHPALGVARAPPLLHPGPDLGRRPEPSGRDLGSQVRLLLGRQERRRPLAPGMAILQRRQPASSIPCQPPLHRPLVHAQHLGRLARRPTCPHQPQPMQPGPHVRSPLPPIPLIQARSVVRRRPLHRQFPSPTGHPFLTSSCCSNYTAGPRAIGISLAPADRALAVGPL